MEEIKINEYVRTQNQGIKRIDTIFQNKTINKYGYECGSDWDGKLYSIIKTTDIVNHSRNILELIEKGDYVNGYKVIDICKHFEVQPYRITVLVHKTKYYEQLFHINLDNLESIVTKEQFEQMKYIVRGSEK